MAQPQFTTVSNLSVGGSPTATYALVYPTVAGSIEPETTGLPIVASSSSGDSSSGLTSSTSPAVSSNSTSSLASNTPPTVATTPVISTTPTTPVASGPESTTSSISTYPPPAPSTTQSSFTSSTPTRQPVLTTSTPPSTSNRLANGTVAGIVVGAAVGLALITFLATFLAIRRRRGSGGKGYRQRSDRDDGLSGSARHQTLSLEPKQPLITQTSNGSTAFDDFLPQSADDKTVQNNVKTVLDQIELHVENFYQNTQASGSRLADAELAMFDSPYLPSELASLLPQTSNRILLIKHALAHFITACITTPSDTGWSLLPEDFVLVPNAVRAGGSTKSVKPGFTQSFSRWRTLTAYLRPSTLEDTAYIAQREHQINIIVQNFSAAFAPWQNPRYKDEERVRSLVAILKEAADIGIWLFSQPSDFQFQWPKYTDMGSSRIAVAPALVKITDERGQTLSSPQVMIDMTAKKV